ncbi:Protein of unknown function [Cotesia congregata]|uniref:Uncharacterized protein n=1 Tax=Cotesia congregata TaxID=51543 RepID=A0A8J2MKJ5_COTCN|nr:Protein of unknown function [Cotesia congregata]
MLRGRNTIIRVYDGLISNKYAQKTMLKGRNMIIHVCDGLISNMKDELSVEQFNIGLMGCPTN